jgi:hypothetical protein
MVRVVKDAHRMAYGAAIFGISLFAEFGFSTEVRKAAAVPYELACTRGALLPCSACHLRWKAGGEFCFGKQKAFATQ